MKCNIYHYIACLFMAFIFIFLPCTVYPGCPTADLSGDCIVDTSDLFLFAENWLSIDLPQHPELISHWELNELEGEFASDSAGDYTGLLHGDAQWMPAEGYFGGALSFDGVDDYVTVPYVSALNSVDFTISLWARVDGNLDIYRAAVCSRDITGGYYSGYNIFASPENTWDFWTGAGALSWDILTGPVVLDELWTHVAISFQAASGPDSAGIYTGMKTLYINGIPAASTTAGRYAPNGIEPFTTGCIHHSQLWYFNGLIDDVQVFDQALQDDEVLRLYQTGSVSPHSPDFTADSKVDIQDILFLAQQWLWEEPRVVISEFLASNDAANPPDPSQGQIRDGDGDSSDWIELYNQTDLMIDLEGWGLTDNQDDPLKWRFPAGTLLPGRTHLVVFASDKHPYVDSLGYLHTNFKLSADGEYLALTRPDGTVEHKYDSVLNTATGEYGFPAQEKNISYGEYNNEEFYFSLPTPAFPNRQSFLGFVDEIQFSHERGFYENSFMLTLTMDTPDAVIRYTTNGTDPTLSNGITYTVPIPISISSSFIGRQIRAAAFKPGYQSRPIKTKTYLMKATAAMKGLPAICLSGSPTGVFYNPYGIMAIVGGTWSNGVWIPLTATDYNNVLGHGMDYERPVSMEYIRYAAGTEFQEDCGIRIHGSAWMRPRYTPAPIDTSWSGSNKYSFRLYFRSLYGESKFRHSVIDKYPEIEEMDTFVLRAGHNDQTNPFVRDEMIRRLQYQMGHQASRGTFTNLFVNGVYKGYYNLCERIDESFCQQWYNSDKDWDVVGWVVPGDTSSYLEARDGDMVAFNELINFARTNNLTNPLYYGQVEQQMDMTGFVDYIILQCWGGNWDWPQNNWTATAERSPQRKWRFFVWDAEGAMDGTLSQDRFSALNSDGSDLSKLYRALKVNDDFKVLFTDRLYKHFLEIGGVMTSSNLTSLFSQLAGEVQSVIPYIDMYIPNTFIPNRQSTFFSQCVSQGLYTFAAPRIFLNGQEIQKEYALENSLLTMQNASGVSGNIYYTLDGSDPRLTLQERSAITTVALVDESAPKKIKIPTSSDTDTAWRGGSEPYTETGWTSGSGGTGYERGSGYESFIGLDVESAMYNVNSSCYIRIPFAVDGVQLPNYNTLTLKVRYDDGFVAFINGTEVTRGNFTGTPAWNSSTGNIPDNTALIIFDISPYLYKLHSGTNILAIQGLNAGSNSSDFLVSASLEMGYNSSNGISSRASKYTSPVALTKSAHVKARTLNGTQWGAAREAFISVGPLNENLRISEIMYHPNGDPNEEYVELTNIGTAAINLNKVSFTEGIQFTFSDMILGPGQFLLLVRNSNIFEGRYGSDLPVIGQFEGALENAGEQLKLSDILGNSIQTVDYKDSWYEITDGDGFSLTPIDPAFEKTGVSLTNLAAGWTFNETSGVTVYDTLGHCPGTIYNMTSTSRVYGREDKSLIFEGVNDYITVPYNSALNPIDFTVVFWARINGNWDIYRAPVCNRDITGGFYSGYNVFVSPLNKWEFWTGSGDLSWDVLIGPAVTDRQWTHVAIAFQATSGPDASGIYTGTKTLYINGIPVVNTTDGKYVPNGLEPFTVGRINHSQLWYFNGEIDDIRLYNRALESKEVSVLAGSCWGRKEMWRPSAIRGGTPGRAETAQEMLPLPDAIVINELLAHSHGGQLDWFELYNTTGQNIDIGGWFLSDSFDSDSERMKYQIPAGTILTPANPYYVIEEDRFNNSSDPGCLVPFALSEGGETIYLQSAQSQQLTGYFTMESFGATQTDVSLGRYQKSDGNWNFVPMSIKTQGAANAYPKVGPIIISEIMYNPGSDPDDEDYEYLELMNNSPESVRTASYVSTYTGPDSHIEEWISWKFTDGIEFEFPVNLWIEPGQRILLVKDRAAFDSRYTNVPAGTVIYEWADGKLANEGETVQIAMAGDKEYLEDRYYIRQERVKYSDGLHPDNPYEPDLWPTGADGQGQSLGRMNMSLYGNDSNNWQAITPTPGL